MCARCARYVRTYALVQVLIKEYRSKSGQPAMDDKRECPTEDVASSQDAASEQDEAWAIGVDTLRLTHRRPRKRTEVDTPKTTEDGGEVAPVCKTRNMGVIESPMMTMVPTWRTLVRSSAADGAQASAADADTPTTLPPEPSRPPPSPGSSSQSEHFWGCTETCPHCDSPCPRLGSGDDIEQAYFHKLHECPNPECFVTIYDTTCIDRDASSAKRPSGFLRIEGPCHRPQSHNASCRLVCKAHMCFECHNEQLAAAIADRGSPPATSPTPK